MCTKLPANEKDLHPRFIYRNIEDGSFVIPSKKSLVASLERYSKANNKDINVKLLLQGSNTAYYLDKYINEGHLDEYKSMSQIRNDIKNEYNTNLSGSQLSKLLSKRYEWKIICRKTGEKKRNV